MIVAGIGSGNQDYNQIMKSILTSISYMQLVHLMCMHDKLTVTSKTSFDFSICEKLINGYKWPQHRRDTGRVVGYEVCDQQSQRSQCYNDSFIVCLGKV